MLKRFLNPLRCAFWKISSYWRIQWFYPLITPKYIYQIRVAISLRNLFFQGSSNFALKVSLVERSGGKKLGKTTSPSRSPPPPSSSSASSQLVKGSSAPDLREDEYEKVSTRESRVKGRLHLRLAQALIEWLTHTFITTNTKTTNHRL